MPTEPTRLSLPAAQFFTRWITHLCAPAFVLLAGMSVALAGERRGPAEARAFDRHLLALSYLSAGGGPGDPARGALLEALVVRLARGSAGWISLLFNAAAGDT